MEIKLSDKLSGYSQGLVDSCNVVKKALTADYAEDRARLGRYLKAQMSGSVYNIGRQEFIKPLAETVVSAAASSKLVEEQIIKAAEYMKDKFTSSSNLIQDQYNKDGVIQKHEREPVDLETTIRKKGVGTKADGIKHKVKNGETVWEIAKKYGMTEAELLQANPKLKMYQDENGVNIVMIHPRDKIFIPAKYAPVTHSTTNNQSPHETQPLPTTSNVANDNHKAGSTLGSCPGDGPGIILAPKMRVFEDTATPWNQIEFTFDPLQYILMDPDINQNGNINNNAFGDGAIAATLTTLDQGTEEIFKYGVGKKSGIYKYHTYKMGIITSVIDYNINLQEQRINCPSCDARVNQIVAGVQTAVGNGLSGIGAAVGGIGGGPFGAVAGAVTASTIYSASDANKQVGELARPIAQYIVNKYDNLIKNNNYE